MTRPDTVRKKRANLGVIVLVALLHLGAVIALVHAFAPRIGEGIARNVTEAFTVVTVTTTPPSPRPETRPAAAEREGAAAQAGKKSVPKPVAVPKPRIAIATQAVPPVAGQGIGLTSGARDAGTGTGAGGQGNGTGSGASGSGAGGGGGSRLVKIAGEINSARDYPPASRELRLGDHVVIALTVGIDGRVKGCRVIRASRDPEADRITCRLATERFRFRSATNSAGVPVEAVYGWQQRWFDPRENKK